MISRIFGRSDGLANTSVEIVKINAIGAISRHKLVCRINIVYPCKPRGSPRQDTITWRKFDSSRPLIVLCKAVTVALLAPLVALYELLAAFEDPSSPRDILDYLPHLQSDLLTCLI